MTKLWRNITTIWLDKKNCVFVFISVNLTGDSTMTLSYSKKAYPWDNACIESFHALIKREWINRFKIHSYSEAKRLVFQYIETFYNTVRIHSHCGFKSPKQLEDEYQTQIQNLVVA